MPFDFKAWLQEMTFKGDEITENTDKISEKKENLTDIETELNSLNVDSEVFSEAIATTNEYLEQEIDSISEDKKEVIQEAKNKFLDIEMQEAKIQALDAQMKSLGIEIASDDVYKEFDKEKSEIKELLNSLDVEVSDTRIISGAVGVVTELADTADSVSEIQEIEKELFFFGDKSKNHKISSSLTVQESMRLQRMGVKRVCLDSCHEKNRQSVVNAVEKMFNEHPELRGQVLEINCHQMSNGTYASYGPTHFGSNFGGVLNINSDYFSDPNLDDDLREKSRMGWFVPNASSESIIEHELGHGMHLELCALSCGVQNGSIPDSETYNKVIQQYMDDVHADTIVENACRSLNIEFDTWEFSRQLSKYGGSNYGEAIAEAVSEVEHNENPRPLASAIYRELLAYKQNFERRS